MTGFLSALMSFLSASYPLATGFLSANLVQLVIYVPLTIAWAFLATKLVSSSGKSDASIHNKLIAPKQLTRELIEPLALRRWKEVLTWITFSPHELCWVDKKGQTVLHHACLFQAPVHVIEMIVLQAPELARMTNEDDELPLHWAIRLSLSNQVLRILLSANPSSGVYARDKDGNTPLSLLWERHQESLLRMWWNDRNGLVASPAWCRITFLMKCSYFGTVDHPTLQESGSSNLHIAARCLCPPALFPLALRVYRDQLEVQDIHGRTPLAMACENYLGNRNCDVLTKIDSILAEYESHNTLRLRDKSGRIPFLIALASGISWDEGIKKFFAIDSGAISMRDPVTKLYPFMLAAVGARRRMKSTADLDANDDSLPSLTTVYNLLRADPLLVCETVTKDATLLVR